MKTLLKRLALLAPQKTRRRFTSEEDDAIIKALESGTTTKEIAQSLNRNVKSIQRRIKILDQSTRLDPAIRPISRRPYTAADFELMREKVERGMSWNDIAAESFPERSGNALKLAYRRYKAKNESG